METIVINFLGAYAFIFATFVLLILLRSKNSTKPPTVNVGEAPSLVSTSKALVSRPPIKKKSKKSWLKRGWSKVKRTFSRHKRNPAIGAVTVLHVPCASSDFHGICQNKCGDVVLPDSGWDSKGIGAMFGVTIETIFSLFMCTNSKHEISRYLSLPTCGYENVFHSGWRQINLNSGIALKGNISFELVVNPSGFTKLFVGRNPTQTKIEIDFTIYFNDRSQLVIVKCVTQSGCHYADDFRTFFKWTLTEKPDGVHIETYLTVDYVSSLWDATKWAIRKALIWKSEVEDRDYFNWMDSIISTI